MKGVVIIPKYLLSVATDFRYFCEIHMKMLLLVINISKNFILSESICAHEINSLHVLVFCCSIIHVNPPCADQGD